MSLGFVLMKQIFGTKRELSFRQSNQPRSYDILNENKNLMIRNHRHLILTNGKFTEKFSYDNIVPTTTKLLESVTPLQSANLPKRVTASTFINSSKSIVPNSTKVTRSGRVLKKPKQVY